MGRLHSRIRSSVVGVGLVMSVTAAVAVALIVVAGAASFGAAGRPGTRANPHPRGHKVMIEKFAISVVGVDTNAWARLRKASPRNVAPGSGTTYVLVTMRATNRGRTEGIPLVGGLPDAIGHSKKVYSPFGGCGAIPNDIANLSGIAPGHTVTANTCWVVSKPDVPSLVMFYEPYNGGNRIFFSLH